MTPESTPRRILIIDDDADVVTYLETVFRDHGYEPLCAADGEAGLEIARAQLPDLICLDISMPAPSGVRVYRELRGDPKLAGIPVVMVTGVLRQFEDFIGRRRQVPPPDAYIAKPFQVEELLNVVRRILGAPATTS